MIATQGKPRITVGGVDIDVRELSFSRELNERSLLTYVADGPAPSRFAEVVLYEIDMTTPMFGGLVMRRAVGATMMAGSHATVSVECCDYILYADFAYVSLEYTVPVLVEDVLADIVAELAVYGITYTPVAYGLTALGEFIWTDKRASDALREVANRCGRVIKFTPSKELLLVEPGTTSAPSNVSDANPNVRDLAWNDPPEFPVNRIVLYGGEGTRDITESFTADGLSHGGITNYVTAYPATNEYAGLWPNLISVNGVTHTVGWEPLSPLVQDGGSFEWVWDAVNHRLRHDDTTFGLTTGGHVITMITAYRILYPYRISVDTGASPVITKIVDAPDALTIEQGTEIAESLLTNLAQEPREFQIPTTVQGIDTGQEITLTRTDRGVSAVAAIITRLELVVEPETALWSFNGVAVDSATYRGSYLDKWREMLGSGGGGRTSISGTGGGTPATVVTLVHVSLGGRRDMSVAPNPAAYTPVPDYLEFVASATFSARVRVALRARSAGITATARLRNVTDSTTAGTSSGVTGTTWTDDPFLVTITAGKTYRLEILSSSNGEGVYGIGALESL